MRFIIISILIVSGCGVFQKKINSSEDCLHYYDSTLNMKVYKYVDQKPIFSADNKSFENWLQDNFINSSFKGGELITTFYYSIIIDTCGYVVRAEITNKKNEELVFIEKELLKVLEESPKWIPGKCEERTVNVKLYSVIKY